MKDKIDGVILAAGLSTRAGRFKMAMPVDNKSIIQWTIEKMLEFCTHVIVVTGYHNEIIVELTKNYSNLKIVFNPYYKKGMFTSVQKGIGYIETDWFFLSPGDIPLISSNVYRNLLDARLRFPKENVFIPVFNGHKGHPILLNHILVESILAEPEESNLREVINRKGYKTIEVADESILFDIDTQEDYQQLKLRMKKN